MPIRIIGLLCGAVLLLSAGLAQAAPPFDVSVRAEGKGRTLVTERTVTLSDAPVIKDGNPDHACPGQAAIGALQQGSGGNWEGSWSEGLGYFVTAIAGSKPKGSAYFELWINRRQSMQGICDATLEAGDDVLFFVQDCEYDPALEGCADPITPLGVRVPATITKGTVRNIKVVDHAPNGRATPEAGARVFVNGESIGRTDSDGTITVKGTDLGRAKVYAKKAGKVRSETDTFRVVKP